MSAESSGLSRRDLLKAASLSALTLGAGEAAEAQNKPKTEDRNKNKTLPRRRLGRTNMMVTVVAAGGSGITSPDILDTAIERGVNYIDTAASYGNSEEIFGEVMKTRRKEVFLATKWWLMADATVDEHLDSLHRSLKRLQTDHVDLLQVHSLDANAHDPKAPNDGFQRIDSPNQKKAMEIARKNGLVRFFGVSSHHSQRKELLTHAIDTGLYDTILVAFNYSNYEHSGMEELLEYAKKHDIGVIGMKAGQGNINVPDVKPLSAQLAWVLSKNIHTVINSRMLQNEEGQDACFAAPKVKLSQADRDTLERYAAAVQHDYCRGCSHLCESACPIDIKIGDLLRFEMYHRHYGGGHQEFARQSYAELADNLNPFERHFMENVEDTCTKCGLCERACPYDLPIVDKLRYVHRELS